MRKLCVFFHRARFFASLRHFTPFSLLPSLFWRSLLLTNFHCSFFIFLCSLLLFHFSSCSHDIFSCSISKFLAAPCSLFLIFLLPAPKLRFPCSLLPSLFQAMLLSPLGLKHHSPCSLFTPNGGSVMLVRSLDSMPVLKSG